MDEFSIELSRGLYHESLSYERRSERYNADLYRGLNYESTPSYLISQINLKSVSGLMLFGLVLASVAMLISSYRAVNFLERALWVQGTSAQTQTVQAKDIEIITRDLLAAEKDQFMSELGKTKNSQNAFIEEKSQVILQRVAALEHSLRGEHALELLNTFQISFSEWRLQHEEWVQKFGFGDPDLTYGVYAEQSEEHKARLYSSAYNLSATMDDLHRRQLARIAQQEEFFKARLRFSAFFLFLTIGIFFWTAKNVLGALSEFLRWFRKQSWDLHVEAQKLKEFSQDPQGRYSPQELAGELSHQATYMKSVLAHLVEVFSGEINGERLPKRSNKATAKAVRPVDKILKFEVGAQKMQALLKDHEGLPPPAPDKTETALSDAALFKSVTSEVAQLDKTTQLEVAPPEVAASEGVIPEDLKKAVGE